MQQSQRGEEVGRPSDMSGERALCAVVVELVAYGG